MLLYLINASLIWLVSLVFYELLLKKETFHQYNRLYLIGTLSLGLLLPLWHFNAYTDTTNPKLQNPVIKVAQLKQIVVQGTSASDGNFWVYSWLMEAAYVLGVLIALFFILREAIQLYNYYRNGHLTREGSYTIVETGEDHSPFSFFRIIFISHKKIYSQDEWQHIKLHEQEHANQWHLADKLFLLVIRTLFWFHPLVYSYYKKLMIIHEFQADAIADKREEYGSFLLEQALLGNALTITHSFSYSPIKNRILMLTRKSSSKLHLIKYLGVLPLIIALTLFCSNCSFSQNRTRNGNMITFKGNVFELAGYPEDTVVVIDPASGKQEMRVLKRDSSIVKMNGEPVGGSASYVGEYKTAENYLFSKIKDQLQQLQDGDYAIDIRNMIVDKTGRIVYYEIGGINPNGKNVARIDPQLKKAIDLEIENALTETIIFRPSVVDGKDAVSNANIDLQFRDRISVKNHKAAIISGA